MFDAAGQAILHSTVALVVIEALLRLWRVDGPGERLALRWLAVAGPFALTVGYLAWVPFRSTGEFAERWALFAGAHWNEIRVGGVGAATAATAALGAIGLALYLRDAVPFLADRIGQRASDEPLPHHHPAYVRVHRSLQGLSGEGAGRPSTLSVVDRDSPVLLCGGVDRTTILVSTGALARLDEDQLEAALAHELAHLSARDPLAGWLLMALRTLQCFNPVTQVLARQAVQEIERRADAAAAAQGRGPALAGAIARLSDAPDVDSDLLLPASRGPISGRALSLARQRAVEARCRALVEPIPPAPPPARTLRTALGAAALALLLFLVV